MANLSAPAYNVCVLIAEFSFPVIVQCNGVDKAYIVVYGVSSEGDFGLRAQIRDLFHLQALPVLEVS